MADYAILMVLFVLIIIIISVFVYIFLENKKYRIDVAKREAESRRKMYELSILKELGDRIGYSLNIQNIIDIITGSLHQFIQYSIVSYMFLEPEKIIFKLHLEKSVSRKFVDDIKNRMLGSLSALLNKDFKSSRIEEILSGVVLAEELEEPVRSFFNIPLVITGKVVGVLTIADTTSGLYKEEEMTILYKITQQASSAVSRLQEVVKIEQKKLSAMVFSMTEGVVMTDPDYRIMVVNPAAKKAVGLGDKKELTIFDFIDKLSGKFDFRGKIEESVKLDKIFLSEEVQLQGRFFQIATSPVKSDSEKGKILGCIVIFHDITEEKEVEKMKEDFTSMIVHELRSPLDVIKRAIDAIRFEKISKSKSSEYLQMIYKDSSGMLSLINNLLDMAKMEAGKFEISKRPSNIKQIVEGRVSFFGRSAKDAKIKLSAVFGEDIPESADFDPYSISQVLNNLISNAIKFSKEKGKIVVEVLFCKKGTDVLKQNQVVKKDWFLNGGDIDFIKDADYLLVAVTDSGAGIPEAEMGSLFNKFSQAKSMFVKKEGTGLGLAVSKSIVESHKGAIGVKSIEGKGSTFYFVIPTV